VAALLSAASETRPVFWHFVTWLRVLWYLLAGLSVLVFLYGLARPIAKYRRGGGERLPPPRELVWRLLSGLRTLLAHRTIARRDATAGWAHRAIFYGFTTLFAGTVILGFDTDFTDPVFGWNYFHGAFYLAYKEVLNVLGTALLAGLLVMMVRRPKYLEREGNPAHLRRIPSWRAGTLPEGPCGAERIDTSAWVSAT
jgi:hypothetical protein